MAAREIVTSKYWNTNGVGISVVAIEGHINDVGAYIGASEQGAQYESAAREWAINYGAKLTQEEALGMLPRLAEIMEENGMHYRR